MFVVVLLTLRYVGDGAPPVGMSMTNAFEKSASLEPSWSSSEKLSSLPLGNRCKWIATSGHG
jgi:hypothetical protein